MKFTVREVGTHSVTVDFEDGSWAEVPYSEGLTCKADLIRLIHTFSPRLHTLPAEYVTAGEELDSLIIDDADERVEEEEPITYQQMRQELYPSRGDQLDALYWARKGDSSHLEEIDKAIEEVKSQIPKNIPPMTREAFSQYLLSL
tara:strand:+ start:1132 stop:1566 length:435 start_codon:yes stop_codon:yes gene_type:complete